MYLLARIHVYKGSKLWTAKNVPKKEQDQSVILPTYILRLPAALESFTAVGRQAGCARELHVVCWLEANLLITARSIGW